MRAPPISAVCKKGVRKVAGKERVDNKNAKKKCVLLAQGEGGHGGHPKLAQ
jgi:hypothetical protein